MTDTRDDAFAKGMRSAFHWTVIVVFAFTIAAGLGGWLSWIRECC